MTRLGRPPLDADKRRGAPIQVRFTDEERQLITDAAAADNMSVSNWVRARAIAAAKRAKQR